MYTIFQKDGDFARFILAGLTDSQAAAAQSLHYRPVASGYAKTFPSSTPGLERVYANFARHAKVVLQQAAGELPVPWEACLEEFLHMIAAENLDWWLGGSASLAVRGIAVMPRDVDLIVAEASVPRLVALLQPYLVEPLQYFEGWVARWFARAFLYSRLEWVGGVASNLDDEEVTDFGPVAHSRLETVCWRGHALRVAPLDLIIPVSERRGLTQRAAAIRVWQQQQTA